MSRKPQSDVVITELDCGCTHNGHGDRCGEWVKRCPPHKAAHDELHERAMRDYRRKSNEDLR
jgi:hypothetical protein